MLQRLQKGEQVLLYSQGTRLRPLPQPQPWHLHPRGYPVREGRGEAGPEGGEEAGQFPGGWPGGGSAVSVSIQQVPIEHLLGAW